MDIYYENSAGTKLYLDRPPYNMLSSTSLFDYEWQEGSDPRTSPRRASSVREISLVITGTDQEDYSDNLDGLLETIETDAMKGVYGRLYVGDWYLTCYMSKNVKGTKYINVKQSMVTLTVKPEGRGWIRESLFQFRHSGQQADEPGLGYPYDYPYDYRRVAGYDSELTNEDALSDSDFTMTIYGPAMEPEISIGDALYCLHCEVPAGERAVIDSMSRRIILTGSGNAVNIFRFRDSSRIFDRIPPGQLPVYWNGAYDFDLMLYDERGEPAWT